MKHRFWPALVFLAVAGPTFAEDISLKDWTVPQYSLGGLGKAVDATPPRAFIGLRPCRILDTRGNGAPITGGIFANSEARSYTITNICGLPVGTDAVSVNFTVTGSPAAPPGAFLLAWPQGGPTPPVSILNFQAGQTVANAAIVPLNVSGQLTINVSHATHVIMDVNGYFSDIQSTTANFFRLEGNVPFPNGVIVGENSSIFGSAAAILGEITSTLPGAGSAGVRGINSGTGAFGVGVWGSQAGSGWGVNGEALGTSGAGSKGVYGISRSSTAGAVGVHGLAAAGTGGTYGVFGETNSQATGAVGVLGVDGSGPAYHPSNIPPAGVRGESAENYGVLGFTTEGGGSSAVYGCLTIPGDFSSCGALGRDLGANNYGVYAAGDYGGSGAKFFVEPHPGKADMVIRYVALEGPESGTYFRGKGKFQNGVATIEVPSDFGMVTDEEGLSVQVTPIGDMATVAVARVGLDRIVVKSSRNVEFFYLVNGVRRSHKHLKPVGPGQEYMPETPEATMPAYLTEVQKEMLVSNGTYKADGTVNMETAKALGWTKVWEKRSKNVEKKSGAASRKQRED